MLKKICNNCKEEKNIDCFSLKDTQGHRRGTCKKCVIISKKKFTCDIPPNTKICTSCNNITKEEDFILKNSKCTNCRLKPNEKERRELYIKNLKRCIQCEEVKPLIDFRKKHTVKLGFTEISYCKTCENKKRDVRRKKAGQSVEFREYQNLKKKEIRDNLTDTPEKRRLFNDKLRCKRFGIDITEYYNMRDKQENKCYICNEPEQNINKVLSIDHCHKTNKIRKLLCHRCNVNLGILKEDLEYIEKLKYYIIEHL